MNILQTILILSLLIQVIIDRYEKNEKFMLVLYTNIFILWLVLLITEITIKHI